MASLSIAKEFSRFPAGRYATDGPDNGERFRDSILMPRLRDAIMKSEQLRIQLDGVFGLPSSFLEEAFGGILRVYPDVELSKLLSTLVLQYDDIRLAPSGELIARYIKESASKAKS